MLCDICKVKQATIFYTEVKDGQKKEQHLCEECAAGQTTLKLVNPITNQPMTIGGLLSGILENYAQHLAQKGGKIPFPTCKSCGMSYEEFLKSGRFGCVQCYQSFGALIDKTLNGIHGTNHHIGSHPARFTKQDVATAETNEQETKKETPKVPVGQVRVQITRRRKPTDLQEQEPKPAAVKAQKPKSATAKTQEPKPTVAQASKEKPEPETEAQLQAAMQEAVEREDYEEAARLRDLLRARRG